MIFKSTIAVAWIVVISGVGLLQGGHTALTPHFVVVSEPGGKPVEVNTSGSRATVVFFVSALCPISTDYGGRLPQFARDYVNRCVRVFLVNSNQNETDSQVERQRREARLP